MNDATPESTPAPAVDTTPAASQPDSTQDVSTDIGTDVNWEQRYKDTQASFTKGQQELSTLRQEFTDYIEQTKPVLDQYKEQQEFEQYRRQKTGPTSAWDYEGGIDGAIAARDREIESLRTDLKQTQENSLQQQAWQTKQQFKQDQYRLYKEFGSTAGSEEAFAEILKEIPKYDPNWEQAYMENPSYDTIQRSYLIMRGAANYDPESIIAKQEAARKEQEFLEKQGNYLGGSEGANIGPSKDNPNAPYMSPIRQ